MPGRSGGRGRRVCFSGSGTLGASGGDGGLGEHQPEHAVTRPALGPDAASLKIGDGLGTSGDRAGDVAVAFPSADAHDHVMFYPRLILRLSLNNDKDRSSLPPVAV